MNWIKKNLFSSKLNSLITIVLGILSYHILMPFLDWAILHANFQGTVRQDCELSGACWPFVFARFKQFMYGFYPEPLHWRVNVSVVLIFCAIAVIFIRLIPVWLKASLLVAITTIMLVLLNGGILGLASVSTDKWGGLFLTLLLASGGIICSFPIALLLALGRFSKQPIFKTLSISFIELVRGVPLISVLFMASVMFPMLMPQEVELDKLLRAFIGIVLFQAAYLAEVIRGGLKSLPSGQFDAADSLGLSYWQGMQFIILPQAIKVMIPGIVNTFIALFKDTTLVLIIGLFDFLGIVQAATTDSEWVGMALEGYVFCAIVYWIFCYGMSKYSQHLEKRAAYVSRA